MNTSLLILGGLIAIVGGVGALVNESEGKSFGLASAIATLCGCATAVAAALLSAGVLR